jgi:hypothetical protein
MKYQNIETGNTFVLPIITPDEVIKVQELIDSGEFKIIEISKEEESKIKFKEPVIHICLEERLLEAIKKAKTEREKSIKEAKVGEA